jgi:hypothetical protein
MHASPSAGTSSHTCPHFHIGLRLHSLSSSHAPPVKTTLGDNGYIRKAAAGRTDVYYSCDVLGCKTNDVCVQMMCVALEM